MKTKTFVGTYTTQTSGVLLIENVREFEILARKKGLKSNDVLPIVRFEISNTIMEPIDLIKILTVSKI